MFLGKTQYPGFVGLTSASTTSAFSSWHFFVCRSSIGVALPKEGMHRQHKDLVVTDDHAQPLHVDTGLAGVAACMVSCPQSGTGPARFALPKKSVEAPFLHGEGKGSPA
jgi:hypothetical protein